MALSSLQGADLRDRWCMRLLGIAARLGSAASCACTQAMPPEHTVLIWTSTASAGGEQNKEGSPVIPDFSAYRPKQKYFH